MAETTTLTARTRFLGYGACAVAGCLWGTGFYFGRLALNEMSVEHMVLYRFLFACVGMLPVALLNRVRFTWSEIRIILISSAFGIPIQFLIQFHGLAHTTVSHASLMVGAMPVLLGVAAAIFAGERLDRIGWAALVASTIGAALIVLGGHRGPAAHGEPTLYGDLLVVLSLCTALSWILLSKKLMQTHSPVVVTAYSIVTGTVMLAALDPWPHAPQSLARGKSCTAAIRPRQRDRLGSFGHQRPCLHGYHNLPLELGHPSCSSFARRRLPQYRACAWLLPRCQTARRTPRTVRMGWRRAYSGRGHRFDHPGPRTPARRDPGVKRDKNAGVMRRKSHAG